MLPRGTSSALPKPSQEPLPMTTALTETLSAKHEQRLEQYHELVRQAATGEECDADTAEGILRLAGKTHQDFKSDVRAMQGRFATAQLLREAQDANAEYVRLHRMLTDLEAERVAAINAV